MHFLWFFRGFKGKPLRLQIFTILEHFLFIILPHTEEAVMGCLRAERNSISGVESTTLAIIKRNVNKELDMWLIYVLFLSDDIFILKYLNKMSIFLQIKHKFRISHYKIEPVFRCQNIYSFLYSIVNYRTIKFTNTNYLCW